MHVEVLIVSTRHDKAHQMAGPVMLCVGPAQHDWVARLCQARLGSASMAHGHGKTAAHEPEHFLFFFNF